MTDARILSECSKGYKLNVQVGKYSHPIYDSIQFLDKGNGADGNDGLSWESPVKTINAACDNFYSGVKNTARGRHFAVIYRGRLTGGNAETAQQIIDVPGVHLIGAGELYGDSGGFDSCMVNSSQIPAEDSHFSGIGAVRAALRIEADNVSISGMKFYCNDETNTMTHVVVHDYDQNNSTGFCSRNVRIENCHFQGDPDGTAEINGVGVDGGEAVSIRNCRFQHCHYGIKFAGGGTRYCHNNVYEGNVIVGPKYGIQGGNATARDNLIKNNTIIQKGVYGWALTYGIDGANSSTDNMYVGNFCSHATEGTAFNYGTGNYWINNYYEEAGGILANPDE